MYALVDCNNFYASCERVFKPSLIGQPIVVLSNNDGCVISRSNEAKAMGVKMGIPFFEVQPFINQYGLKIFSSNYELYGDMSNRVMNILASKVPEIEIYSIDEAFLKLDGMEKTHDLHSYGVEMAQTVKQWTSIPISVGIAPTKALAKVANKIAKLFPDKTDNCYLIDTEEKRIKALKWTKVEDVWGIGRKHAKKLQALGIRTAWDFTQMNEQWVRRNMSVVGLRLKHDLMGIRTLDLETISPKQSITCTRSFETNYRNLPELSERIATFSASVAEKLRNQNSHCNLISVFILSNGFRNDLPQHRGFISLKTEFPTNSTFEINRLAQQALKMAYQKGIDYKKAGIIVSGLTSADQMQLKFFGGENPKHIDVMQTIDKLNRKIGEHKIKFGNNDLERQWKMKQNHLSPRYTTNWNDLLEVE